MDAKAYGRWLLDWLYDQTDLEVMAEIAQAIADRDPHVDNMIYAVPYQSTSPFFDALGLPGIAGHPVVAYLCGQGWAETTGYYGAHDRLMDEGSDPMEQDVASPRARLTPAGVDAAPRNRASRRTAPVDLPPADRLLRWLYRETRSAGGPADLVNFLPSDDAVRGGTPGFGLREVQDVARYLHEKGLITDPGSQPEHGLGQHLVELTPSGRECCNGYNSNVSQYLESGNSRHRQAHGHHVEMGDHNTVQMSFGDGPVKQQINVGVSVEDALRFADFVSEASAVLRAAEGNPADFALLASEVRGEAVSSSPDKRRLGHFIDALMRALKTATPEALAYTAIELGEKAIHALGV